MLTPKREKTKDIIDLYMTKYTAGYKDSIQPESGRELIILTLIW